MNVIKRNTRPHLIFWFICVLLLHPFSSESALGEIHKPKRAKSGARHTATKQAARKKSHVRKSGEASRAAVGTRARRSVKKAATSRARIVTVEGTIRSSVYKALIDRGENAELVAKFVKILGYDIDFVQEPRQGDRFRILVERQGGRAKGGRILAAEYDGEVTGRVRAYWYGAGRGMDDAYYSEDGDCLERTFMRSPLSVLRVTSPFGMRVHPVSGNYSMHKGTDYGAPVGTPVWAVSAGTVSFAGRRGGYGNLVEITHPGGVVTRYGHLSRIAVHAGQKIAQGRIIGKVGSTGVSTGPHLHFEFLQGGTPVAPRNIKNLALGKLTGKNLAAFKSEMKRINGMWN